MQGWVAYKGLMTLFQVLNAETFSIKNAYGKRLAEDKNGLITRLALEINQYHCPKVKDLIKDESTGNVYVVHKVNIADCKNDNVCFLELRLYLEVK